MKMTNQDQNCSTCFYGKDHESGNVQCRRFPPQLILVEGTIKPFQPLNFPDTYCGEWMEKMRNKYIPPDLPEGAEI